MHFVLMAPWLRKLASLCILECYGLSVNHVEAMQDKMIN